MGLLNKLFNKRAEKSDLPLQDYKNNIYESEISQYSSLPRYYYIQGQKYDIDSPESVSSIPICKTTFSINNETWGIDTVLREHINRHYSKIPLDLRESGYKKIQEYSDSEYITESSAETAARIKFEQSRIDMQKRREEITLKDMEQFSLPAYMIDEIVYSNIGPIILVNSSNQFEVLKDISFLNQFAKEAKNIADISESIEVCTEEIEFSKAVQRTGIDESNQIDRYYTYFGCTPYTKTGKLSKYPIYLRYETKPTDPNRINKEFITGNIYYMQDGTVGKASMDFSYGTVSYIIDLGLKGTTLIIKKITKSTDAIHEVLYKNM